MTPRHTSGSIKSMGTKTLASFIEDISCYEVPTFIILYNLKRSTSAVGSPQQRIPSFCLDGLFEGHRTIQNSLWFHKQISSMPLSHRLFMIFYNNLLQSN